MGTIAYNPTDDRLLIYNIDSDTLPQNTLDPVNMVINPLVKYPGNGLPAPVTGQRYLIVEQIPRQIDVWQPWTGLTAGANPNDIIEFDGTDWTISFDSGAPHDVEYVLNLNTGVQYRYVATEGWQKAWEGWYNQGDWRLII
jgi:hypothetical protein